MKRVAIAGGPVLPSFALFMAFCLFALLVVVVAQEKQANVCAKHCGEGVSWSFTDRSCTCGVKP